MATKSRPAGVPDGFDFEDSEIGGTKYLFRELSVEEGDEIDDAATQPDGTINGRLQLRLLLAKSIVSPVISPDDIAKWPSKNYVKAIRVFNRLSTVPVDPKGSPASSQSEQT